MIRLLFVTTSLGVGGAEMMLYKILSSLDRHEFQPAVAVLKNIGPLAHRIAALDIPVLPLQCESFRGGVEALRILARHIDRFDPQLIQGWMYHGILASELALIPRRNKPPVIWGIRQELPDIRWEQRANRLVIRTLAFMSRRKPPIIFNSSTSLRHHTNFGFHPARTIVIPNGFDTVQFKPSSQAGAALRAELNLPADAVVIGQMARFHAQKDYGNALQAAAKIAPEFPNLHFVLVGEGVTRENRFLLDLIHRGHLQDRVHLLGLRLDVAQLTAGFDIATLSSKTEAFSNSLCEAMACGVPAVVTDVGDLSYIVGDTGVVVPPQNPAALAEGWRRLLRLSSDERREMGTAARLRVIEHFSLPAIAAQYMDLYRSLVNPI